MELRTVADGWRRGCVRVTQIVSGRPRPSWLSADGPNPPSSESGQVRADEASPLMEDQYDWRRVPTFALR